MKLETATLAVERSADFQETTFSIENNAQAFEILSARIYTDVPLAIVRELSTNASDSHIDAGCPDRPFDVHLPNSLEPWFKIRDYGTGLSREQIQTLYTTYFKSTRNTSDKWAGCLGLGSKSPFAYSDQFSVTAYYNGKRSTYSAFKNESGSPTVALLDECHTTEPNGIEIHIPIMSSDIHSFVQAAEKVYTFFKVRPKITGATLKLDNLVPVFTGPGYNLYERKGILNYAAMKAVMGQVAYDVVVREIGDGIANGGCLVLDMPIGSFSFPPSREEVRYDAKSVAAIKATFQVALTDIRRQIEESVSSEAAIITKLQKVGKYRQFITGIKIKGIEAIQSYEQDKYTIFSIREHYRRKGLYIQEASYLQIDDLHNATFFIKDVEDITPVINHRLRHYLKGQLGNGKHYIVEVKDNTRFKEIFGDIQLTPLSTLPKIPRAPRDPARVAAKYARVFWELTSNGWDKNPQLDFTDAYCIPREGNNIVWNGEPIDASSINKMARQLGISKIYGISVKKYDDMRVKHNLTELRPALKELAEKKVASIDEHTASALQHASTSMAYGSSIFTPGLSKEADDYMKVIAARNTSQTNLYSLLIGWFHLTVPPAPNFEEIFFNKYPILLAISYVSSHTVKDHITNYIKLIEAQ